MRETHGMLAIQLHCIIATTSIPVAQKLWRDLGILQYADCGKRVVPLPPQPVPRPTQNSKVQKTNPSALFVCGRPHHGYVF